MEKKRSQVTQSTVKQSKKLSFQERNEMNDVVKTLLKTASNVSSNPKASWEDHLEIVTLLEKIIEIEPEFKPSVRHNHFGNLMKWIKANGGVAENVKISKFENMEYGLEATKDLSKEDVICMVPKGLMMTLQHVQRSPLKFLYNNDPILKNMGNIALALFLIIEYLKGALSFWSPYIASLPEKYNTVLYFSVDDLRELKCSPTFEPALKHCKNIARQYAYFYQVFQTSNDEASRLLKDRFTYQLYRWAVSTVMTRQNYIPSDDQQGRMCALIPLWDMCNHENGYLTTKFNVEEERSECLAFRSFKNGEQVLIFYGKRSNSDFLLHNGFVYPDNVHDTYRLKLGISKSDRLYEERVKLLNRLGLAASGDFHLQSGSEPLDGKLLAFIRIFSMDKGSLEHWADSNRIEDLLCFDCSLDTEIECKAWNFLYNRIKLLLSGYSELKQDDVDITPARRIIRQLCKLEIDLLKSVMDYVHQRLKL